METQSKLRQDYVKTQDPRDKEELIRIADAYDAGYKAANPQWISVKDRLPELNECVVVALPFVFQDEGGPTNHKGCGVETACLRHDGQGAKWSIHTEDKWLVEVSHWMPLPTPPKEEA